jgi:hypothetical protein
MSVRAPLHRSNAMMSLRISCIQAIARRDPLERIKKVGGTNPDGSRWWLTLDEAIAGIEARRYGFYVLVEGRRVDVLVAEHRGRWYLKTELDGDSPDKLLVLPECP